MFGSRLFTDCSLFCFLVQIDNVQRTDPDFAWTKLLRTTPAGAKSHQTRALQRGVDPGRHAFLVKRSVVLEAKLRGSSL